MNIYIYIFHGKSGKIVITGDEALLMKIEGESLDGIEVLDLRVNSDELAMLFQQASSRKTVEVIGRYALMKDKYLGTLANKRRGLYVSGCPNIIGEG